VAGRPVVCTLRSLGSDRASRTCEGTLGRRRCVASGLGGDSVVVVPMPGVLLTNAIYAPGGCLGAALCATLVDSELGEKATREARSLPELAEMVHEGLVARHGPAARAMLVGHSYGGYAALEFAKRFPEHLAGLVLVSTQVRADTAGATDRRKEQLQLLHAKGLDAVLDSIVPLLMSTTSRGDASVVESVRSMARAVGPEAYERQVLACASRADHRATLAALPAAIPVLTISGKEDKITPPRVQQEMRQLLQSRHTDLPVAPCRAAVLEASGHLVPLEQPLAFRRALVAWAGEVHGLRRPDQLAGRCATQDGGRHKSGIIGSMVHALGDGGPRGACAALSGGLGRSVSAH